MEQFPHANLSRQYVSKHYGRQPAHGTETAWQHAQRAAMLMRRVVADCHKFATGTMLKADAQHFVPTSVEEQFGNLISAAWLHEAIERSSANYEALAMLANTEVARLVAAVTRDMRLPVEPRVTNYRASLANADEPVQQLVLTDMICTAQSLQDWYKATNTAEVDQAVEAAVVELSRDLATMSQVEHHPVLRRYAVSLSQGMQTLYDQATERAAARRRLERLQTTIQTRFVHEEPAHAATRQRSGKSARKRVSQPPATAGAGERKGKRKGSH
jgi:hypothetical protein